jgi:hypothetical protein
MRKLVPALLLLLVVLAVPASAARLPLTASRDWWPVWSPDDHQIAFTRINGTGRIFTLEALNLFTHRVTKLGQGAGQLSPTWSPDGTQLAYSSGGVLYVVNANGTAKHRYPVAAKAYAPAWRPGSSDLAYLTTHGARNTDLWVGGFLWARDAIGKPAWVPGTPELAFARDDGIYVASGPLAEQKLASVSNPGSPVGSPTGALVAYSANRSIWIVHTDGSSAPQRLAGPYDAIGPLSWSRQGDALTYTVRGALMLTYLSPKTFKLASTVGVGADFAHLGDLIAFSGSHPGCVGHASIRVYEDNSSIPSYTGGCGIAGTSGADVIFGTTQGGDVIAAGGGNDVVHARNGRRDTVSCGAGRDTVYADRSDRLSGCEVVRR